MTQIPNNQSYLFEPPAKLGAPAGRKIIKDIDKNCLCCEKQFFVDKAHVTAKFCSESCRSKYNNRERNKKKKLEGAKVNTMDNSQDNSQDNENFIDDNVDTQPQQTQKKPAAPARAVAPLRQPKREITLRDVPPHLALVIDLYKREAERAEDSYHTQLAKCEKLEAENKALEKKLQDNDYNARLNGIEAKKPDFLDRLFAAPPELLQGLAPILNRVGDLILPPPATNIAGVPDDITPDQMALLQWIAALPETEQQIIIAILGALMGMDATKRAQALQQIHNVLKSGTTLNGAPGNFQTRDNRMYAN